VAGGGGLAPAQVAHAILRPGGDHLAPEVLERRAETVRVVQAAGRKGIAVAGDIGDAGRGRTLVERATAEFGRLDILVNAVAPGPVWTPLIVATMPPEQAKEYGKQSLYERPAQPAELAPLYVPLAAAASGYITGEVVGVTGGKPIP
jgi:NAD(P)-dependent dehydrogenase (short-subunit alcohol dehydrogenase family)